ncbi:hypothetical protein Lpp124_00060, partial [Lacticaseibacillus paracasei subsp. paracasei CNCM I-4649]
NISVLSRFYQPIFMAQMKCKRSALGQAKGAQAKSELNVAKPHLFRERSDQGLVWGLGRGSPQDLTRAYINLI